MPFRLSRVLFRLALVAALASPLAGAADAQTDDHFQFRHRAAGRRHDTAWW